MIHSYEIPTVGKSIGAESRLVVAMDWGGEKCRLTGNREKELFQVGRG